MTDSGGIQEEAIALKVPVFVLRETTERPELLDAGGGILVGAGTDAICERFNWLLNDQVAYARMRQAKNPFGDGHAADYIARILEQSLAPQDDIEAPASECLPMLRSDRYLVAPQSRLQAG
jgi:UDP-N-acetylglucosamine 2-epimerase